MSRYIDADALKQKYTMVTTRYSGGIMERPAVMLEAIDEAPSIDIVRCEECKEHKVIPFEENACFYWCEFHMHAVNADDFCSRGE